MRRTPQEKKKLSLKKDRRNTYGESPHGARKSIPLNKRLRNRADRHHQENQLPTVPRELEADEVNNIDPAIFSTAPKGWKKVPDSPLAEAIRMNQLQREVSRGRKSRSRNARANSQS